MRNQDEERHQLEQALARMERHLLSTLERTFKDKEKPVSAAQKSSENSMFQRFFNRSA